MHQHSVAVRDVEEVILEWHIIHIADVQGDVVVSAVCRCHLCQLDLRLFYVYAVHFAGMRGFREPDGEGAGAAAKVQHAHAALDVRQQVRGV